ncbi:hypothetical protein [Cellulosimicrobium sp. Marseille-Q4280]|uniref:hypothetical protein n=1 Tax=Cellulosimicrobium sp. Marseille-Q4280 TaxID=2937992 RepID=UPI002040E6A9|nr:hypothetical protein [Cellulosimicrobium sp. Marseille-Q4280]
MTDTMRSRVPAGVTTGGQFATEARGEADVQLAATAPAGVGSPSTVYLANLAEQLGLRGQATYADDDAPAAGWASATFVSPDGDRLLMSASSRTRPHSGEVETTALCVDLERSEDTPLPLAAVAQAFRSEVYGGGSGTWAASSRATVRSVVLTAGMAQAAAGRFERPEHGITGVTFGTQVELPSVRYADDEEYETSPLLTCKVDGEGLTIAAHDDHLEVELGDLQVGDTPDLVRDLVGADLCTRLGIDPGEDPMGALEAQLRDLAEQARQGELYRAYFG